jgi:hypothetical protein
VLTAPLPLHLRSPLQAYEIIIGKRRGKEVEGRPSGGWDFHDWYWRFSMKRRGGGAAEAGAPPPPPQALRDQWRQQLSGLKHKAASKRAAPPRAATEQARAGAATAAAPSSVWRSTTKNARVHQHAEQQAQQAAEKLHNARAAVRPLHTHAAASSAPAPQPDPVMAHAAPPAAESQRQPPEGGAAAPNVDGGAAGAAAAPGDQLQLHSLLHSAVHAVHDMRGRHEHAVHAHAQRVTSQIVALGEQLRARLHVHGLRELLKVDGVGSGGGGDAAAPRAAQSGAPGGRGYAGAAFAAELHVQFGEAKRVLREAVAPGGASAAAGGDGATAAETAARTYDAHGRKFADRDHVQTRLTGQMAGMKRRAALKREL